MFNLKVEFYELCVSCGCNRAWPSSPAILMGKIETLCSKCNTMAMNVHNKYLARHVRPGGEFEGFV
jgi:hypothetical protein